MIECSVPQQTVSLSAKPFKRSCRRQSSNFPQLEEGLNQDDWFAIASLCRLQPAEAHSEVYGIDSK